MALITSMPAWWMYVELFFHDAGTFICNIQIWKVVRSYLCPFKYVHIVRSKVTVATQLWYIVRVPKKTCRPLARISKHACGTAVPQIRRLLLRIGRLLTKSTGFVHTKAPKCCAALLMDLPELCLCLLELHL